MESAIHQIARRFALPHWRWYFAGVVSLAFTTWISVSIPRFSKYAVNGLLEFHPYSVVLKWVLLIIGLGILQILIRSLSRLFLFWPGRKVESELKNFYFDHFLELPLPFFQKHPQGDLISRLANDVSQIRACFAFAVLQVVNLLFLFTFAVYSMLQVSVSLTLLTLSPLLCIILVARIGAPQVHKYFKLGQIKLGDLTNRLTETFLHVDIIQTNDALKSFVDRAAEKVDEVYKANIKLVFIRTVIFPLTTLFTGLSYLVVLYYGGGEVIRNTLTVGDILAFNIYVAMLSFPLTALGIIIALVQRARASSERLVELETFEKEKIIASSESIKPKPLLSVQNLNFSFGSLRGPVLQDINFEVQAGAKLGITGPIGSAKTTLLSLITRLYDPSEGTIFYKGQDILTLAPQDLRTEIGLCLQGAYLFSASVRENLCVGLKDTVSDTELEEAARKAQILKEIESLEHKWETKVGERGVRLSGGQKQRLALARAFLRDHELLLLDDVTAAVDQSTEQRLLAEIKKLQASLILVSHRPSALRLCDEVLVLVQGRILARGPYDTLVDQHPQLFVDLEKESHANK